MMISKKVGSVSVVLLLASCGNHTEAILKQQRSLLDSIAKYEEISWMNNHESQFLMRQYEDTQLTNQQLATVDSLMKVMSDADSLNSIFTLQYDSLERELDRTGK